MPELVQVPLLLVLLLAGAAAAASVDRVLVAVADGRPVGPAASEPFEQAARLLVQRRRTTVTPDALLWRLSGGSLIVLAALMVAVVPLGDGPPLVHTTVGVVWFNTMDVVLWAAFWLLGWGANSLSALVGGYRFLAQALAYELPLMFAITAPAVRAGSLDVGRVVASQDGLWNVVLMPVAFVVLLLGVLGFSALGPFAHPVGDDLSGGVLAELSGVDRLLVLAGRYALLVAGAAFSVPLFLGGGSGPLLPDAVWTLLKTAAVVVLLLAARRRLPVLRGDRLLELGFLVLLPLTVLQLLVPSLLVVGEGR